MTDEREWPIYYVLVGRTPVAADVMTWGKAFAKREAVETDPWRVGYEKLDGCTVSTVFIGIDHSFAYRDEPVLFETMIFGGPLDEYQELYRTYDEAERGHAEAVTKARIAIAKVKAIADAAGATDKS